MPFFFPVSELQKSLPSWKKSHCGSLEISGAGKLWDQMKMLIAYILCTWTVWMTCFPPVSWWWVSKSSFLERRWNCCSAAFSAYVPCYLHYPDLKESRKNKEEGRQDKKLWHIQPHQCAAINFVSTNWVILRLRFSPVWRYLKPSQWQCLEK